MVKFKLAWYEVNLNSVAFQVFKKKNFYEIFNMSVILERINRIGQQGMEAINIYLRPFGTTDSMCAWNIPYLQSHQCADARNPFRL